MAEQFRWVPPPNWPPLPDGWTPPSGWQPDPTWPPPPPGWQFWQPLDPGAPSTAPQQQGSTTAVLSTLTGVAILGFFLWAILGYFSGADSGPSQAANVVPPQVEEPATPPAAARTLLSSKGNGIKTTEEFTASKAWHLHYTYDCASFGQEGLMQVWLVNEAGEQTLPLTNELGTSGTSVTRHPQGGRFSLMVNSTCDWTVRVEG